jgi:UDP-N-acetylmuramoylalanine-D-glutamate ligase
MCDSRTDSQLAGLCGGATGVGGVMTGRPLDQAVSLAATTTQAGDVVLLSPVGTSFDAYADFESRGDACRRAVQALPGFREAPMH